MLAANQFACGSGSSASQIVIKAQEVVRNSQGAVVAALDMANAFGNIRRFACVRELHAVIPEALPFIGLMWHEQGNRVVMRSDEHRPGASDCFQVRLYDGLWQGEAW